MSGHSHWAGIKHKKALVDAKRGKLWSKLAKAIIVAAKAGGGDPDANLRLRYAIDDAKAVSMPKENIQRAIKRGTGELDGGNLEEVVYEGYGCGGVAILCEVLTDNRNRTAGEIRRIFELSDGKLGGSGCVAWMFDNKGLFLITDNAVDEEQADGDCPGGRGRRRAAHRRRQVRGRLQSGPLPRRGRKPWPTPASLPRPARSPAWPRTPSTSTNRKPRKRCCGSWSGSTTTTTCKSYRRTSTFPTKS